MALLGEEVVEEWLNRQGYFTIRGIRIGVHEIDLLAVRLGTGGLHECRHIEVQLSTNPVSYITKVPKKIQKERGIGPANAKLRSLDELTQGVNEWIAKKFDHPDKVRLRSKLSPGAWSRELVVNAVKHPGELDILRTAGVTILRLEDIVREMVETKTIITSAAGADLFTLMHVASRRTSSSDPAAIVEALEGGVVKAENTEKKPI